MNEPASAHSARRGGRARASTREHVVEAAVDVMADHGLDAVSFRTVAMRLGIDPKALYTYVSDKDDLLAAMFDRILADLEVPGPDDPRTPEDRVVDLLGSLRRTLIRNPDTFRLARPSEVPGLNVDAWERVADSVYALDVDPAAGVRVFVRLLHYTLGSAMYAHHARRPSERVPAAGAVPDPSTHPRLSALAKGEPFIEDDVDFAASIRVMLDQRIGEPSPR